MNKEQQELLNEVYKNYLKSFFKGELKENYEGSGYDFDDYYYSIMDVQNLLGWPQDGPISHKEFINKCKVDKEFSEKWGLKIEERELSDEESIFHYEKELYSPLRIIDQKIPVIPTKVITITYNNKTIESYE
jgi:hypothetical protein